MRIGFVTSEVTPYAKTGGLGDVSADLSRQLARWGHDIRVFLPLYRSVAESDPGLVPVDFIQNVPLGVGDRTYRFGLYTLPREAGAALYFVHCPALYGRDGIYSDAPDEHIRFIVLSRAAIEACQRMGWAPDVLHCHDWQSAIVPLYIQTRYAWDRLFADTRTVLTIHNIGYQGIFPASEVADLGLGEHQHRLHQEDLREGRINLLKAGLLAANVITTVSETYAREIQTPAHGFGLDPVLRARRGDLVGIVNGIDAEIWNPETDRRIPHRYSPSRMGGKERNKRALLQSVGLPYEKGVPLAGIVSRLVQQKGFDLLYDPLPDALRSRPLRLVVVGTGEEPYERFFQRLQDHFPTQVAFYRGFSDELAATVEAGSDLFLMPSRYEPCGLNQMYSLRYGTIPVVRRTGGLADTVVPFNPSTGEGTGVVFDHDDPQGLRWALHAALDLYDEPRLWSRIIQNAMAEDFSWSHQGRKYEDLYTRLTGKR
jgi:starch synthase